MTSGHRNIGSRLVPMVGRDPVVPRAATPLELLFDLTFVVAFAQAAEGAAEALAQRESGAALVGFTVAVFATCWAWVNFSWFASAYDTDDWVFRLTTMVQMVGVLILALGIPALFDSLIESGTPAYGVMVAGYAVMRAAVIVQWSRAAVQDTVRRSTALWHAGLIAFAQLLWVLLTTLNESAAFVPVLACALVVELAGPAFADRQNTTPWNPSHIAERYGLFVIIALGEGITGTVSAVAALVEGRGWTDDAVLTVLAGTAITFGLWWVYFLVPSAPVLARFRTRAWVWGYLHIPLLAAVAAEGAGFDLAAVAGEEGRADGDFIAVCVVAVSCAVFIVVAVGLFAVLVRQVVLMQVVALVAALIPVCAGVVIAGAGISGAIALLCVALGPVVLVVSSEAGRARSGRILERALA